MKLGEGDGVMDGDGLGVEVLAGIGEAMRVSAAVCVGTMAAAGRVLERLPSLAQPVRKSDKIVPNKMTRLE